MMLILQKQKENHRRRRIFHLLFRNISLITFNVHTTFEFPFQCVERSTNSQVTHISYTWLLCHFSEENNNNKNQSVIESTII